MQEWSLPTRHVGRTVRVFDSVDSTNVQALALAHDPSLDGLVLLARHQSAGRGQHGRNWLAPPESSVLLSVLLFPPAQLRRPALLTVWAAVSAAEMIWKLTGEQSRIKWPNDVLLKDKKICGILIEQRQQGNALATVAGIGLNVSQPRSFFRRADLPLGGSLFSQTGTAFGWEDVARRLLFQLDEEYASLLKADTRRLESLWKGRLGLIGERVGAETRRGTVTGRLIDVTLDAVVLQAADEVHRLQPETILHLEAAPHYPGKEVGQCSRHAPRDEASGGT